jgi:hypothetical protein
MRTKILLFAATAFVAGVVSSSAQVYSANVVGYVQRTIPAYPGYAVVANPLDTGNNVFTNLLQSLPVGAKVIKWDYPNATFDKIYTRNAIGAGWSPTGSGTNTLNLGEAAVVQLATTSSVPFTVTFIGTAFQGNTTNIMLPGYTLMSFPVPIGGYVTNSYFSLNASLPSAPAQSKYIAYDEVNQNGFTIIDTRNGIGAGWSPAVPQISPAVGFFIVNTASTNRNWPISFTVQ